MIEFTEDEGALEICSSCIGDKALFLLTPEDPHSGKCDFCHKKKSLKLLYDIAETFHKKFIQHYRIGIDEWEDEDGEIYGESSWILEELVPDILGCEPDVSNALIEELMSSCNPSDRDISKGAENFYEDDCVYCKTHSYSSKRSGTWKTVQDKLLHESRYYNPELNKLSDQLFSCLRMASIQRQVKKNPSHLGIERVYRARIASNRSEVEKFSKDPDKELNAPPSGISAPGRMNPQKIPVFYGASTLDAAISEVRPSVGNLVCVAEFNLDNSLSLLCLHDLKPAGYSIFDNRYDKERDSLQFLQELSRHLERPVNDDGSRSDLTYLSTCYFAEYVKNKLGYDGIVFKSIQVPGALNVAIFDPHSRNLRCSPDSVEDVEIESHQYGHSGQTNDK